MVRSRFLGPQKTYGNKGATRGLILYKNAHIVWDSVVKEMLVHSLIDPLPKTVAMTVEAQCDNLHPFSSHQPPHRMCSCGFYAYDHLSDAQNCKRGDGFVIAKVRASGNTFQYDNGYRYSHQRVEEVHITHCYQCADPANQFVLLDHSPKDGFTGKFRLTPVCADHSQDYTKDRLMSFTECETIISLASKGCSFKIVSQVR